MITRSEDMQHCPFVFETFMLQDEAHVIYALSGDVKIKELPRISTDMQPYYKAECELEWTSDSAVR